MRLRIRGMALIGPFMEAPWRSRDAFSQPPPPYGTPYIRLCWHASVFFCSVCRAGSRMSPVNTMRVHSLLNRISGAIFSVKADEMICRTGTGWSSYRRSDTTLPIIPGRVAPALICICIVSSSFYILLPRSDIPLTQFRIQIRIYIQMLCPNPNAIVDTNMQVIRQNC